MSEKKCEYCGCVEEACLARCATTGLYFCNGKGDTSHSHIINHLRTMHYDRITLPESNPFAGHCPFKCFVCNSTNIFRLGFLVDKDGMIYVACKAPCQYDESLSSRGVDPSSYRPIVSNGELISDVVAVPNPDQYTKIPMTRTFAVTKAIRDQLSKDKDKGKDKTVDLSKTPIENAPKPVSDFTPSKVPGEAPKVEPAVEETQEANNSPSTRRSEFSNRIDSTRDVYDDIPQFCRIMNKFVDLERQENENLEKGRKFPGIIPVWNTDTQCTIRSPPGLYKAVSLGSTVRFSSNDISEVGHVIRMSRNMYLEIKFPVTLNKVNKVTVSIVFNSLPFERQAQALQYFQTEKRTMHPVIVDALLGKVDFLDHNRITGGRNAGPPQVANPPRQFFEPLNASQIRCIRSALQQRFTLIQGPPGTGKTTVIAALVLSLVQAGVRPVLVCAQSNVATDFATRRCAQAGIKVVRVLSSTREQVSNDIDAFTTKRLAASRFGDQFTRLIGSKDEADRKEITKMEIKVVSECDAVCTTCTSSGGARIKGAGKFAAVVFDESGQCVDPDILIPLIHGCQQAVLVGDHRQLGPVIMSRKAVRGKYDLPIMQRLILSGVKPLILRMQYRMHPALAAFPNEAFYQNLLTDGVTEQQRTWPTPFIAWPNPSIPMFFWNVRSQEEFYESGLSYVNRHEAGCVAVLLDAMWRHGIKSNDIGVITPYAGQQAFLIDSLPSMCAITDQSFFDEIEIASVDAFQGREKNFIILSNVRANDQHDIGFLKNMRRLCVSLTRARYGLIVIGNADTYSQNKLWVRYIEHCKKNGVFVEGTINNLVPSQFVPDATPNEGQEAEDEDEDLVATDVF